MNGRMVLLLHQLPDGSHHYDWLMQRTGEAARIGLLSYRVVERVDSVSCEVFRATRLADHRETYLTYEGPIHAVGQPAASAASGPAGARCAETQNLSDSTAECDGGMGARGRVTRVASGLCRINQASEATVVIDGRFDSMPAWRWIGTRRCTPAGGESSRHAWIFHREIVKISLGD